MYVIEAKGYDSLIQVPRLEVLDDIEKAVLVLVEIAVELELTWLIKLTKSFIDLIQNKL